MAGNVDHSSSQFKDIDKILVIKFRHIGDVLLTIPTIKALKYTFPDSHLSIIVNAGTEDVLSGNPVIDELMILDRSVKNLPAIRRYIREIKLLRDIRSKGYDMTVDLTGGDRAAILSFFSGARFRLTVNPGREGFPGKRFLYTHLTEVDTQSHMVLQNLEVVENFGIHTDDKDINFFIPEEIKHSVKKTFKDNNIGENDTVVHIHPTARWLFKCWKDEYMAELISWLIAKGIKVVVTSAPDKKELDRAKTILSLVTELQTLNSKLKTLNSHLIDLCGKTTVKELAAISSAADLFIGVDSAPMHIAAAVKTPVIALFGPTGENVWRPFGDRHVVITKNLSCKPCKKGSCEGVPLRDCMSEIKPDDVKESVSKILNDKSAIKDLKGLGFR
jgi:heptosyltransferase-3